MTHIDVSPVDHLAPLEAVNIETHEVIELSKVAENRENPAWPYVAYTPKGDEVFFKLDGKANSGMSARPFYRVRNRREPQSTDPKLVERALKLVEKLAAAPSGLMARGKCEAAWEEAKAIATLIKGPKTDEEWAKHLAAQEGPTCDWDLVLRGIAKGRELQRETGS